MRLIDADDAVKRLREAEKDMRFVRSVGCKAIDFAVVPQFIEGMPTIDAVPVVRCKDCKHFVQCKEVEGVSWTGFCNYGEFHTDEEDFCSRGERRSDD